MTIKIDSNTSVEEIEKLLESIIEKSSFDSSKYNGKLKLDKDPQEIQKTLRDEWS